MSIDQLEYSALRAGTALRIGSIVWPRPYFPTIHERATLVAGLIPSWAIASGRTAGWVWTGMGLPEPWNVLRPVTPAPSPLDRMEWGARTVNPSHHAVERLEGLALVAPEATVVDILLREDCPDTASAQVMMLSGTPTELLRQHCLERRTTPDQRHRLEILLAAVEALRRRYPDITR
jgi:hypothetical protein